MMINKKHINVVWFKRDLRLQDNEAIASAIKSNIPTLILYVFEKSLENDEHYSARHWNFIKQSLEDINLQLTSYNSKVLIASGEILSVFNSLQEKYKIENVFSHQETGIKITYDRDKSFARYCKNNFINWQENINNGIFRGLNGRKNWVQNWEKYMNSDQFIFNPNAESLLKLDEIQELEKSFELKDLTTYPDKIFQKGGSTMAGKYLGTFFTERYHSYSYHISKPLLARKSCSRLSPYIAWGCVSSRQVLQKTAEFRLTCRDKKQIDSFVSRLTWQAHFIQKFEMEEIMEFESVNRGFHSLKKKINPNQILAWQTGQTGFPLVDACMRCLNETGYLNFRMRAMVVSFFTHNLWQPWQECTKHLSQMFLDFEPGIHYPQLQMQSGTTGINTIRIYSPIKNSEEHDSHGIFIKQWLPELVEVPVELLHEPWKLNPIEQQFYNCEIGKDYPFPIVDIEQTRKYASDIVWSFRKQDDVKEEGKRILKKHVNSSKAISRSKQINNKLK